MREAEALTVLLQESTAYRVIRVSDVQDGDGSS
jgi:hypothetical protein